jgi:Ca2+-transporting ATPase
VIAFADPLRPGVSEALAECRNAGIRVIMITGDHPLTAHTVAEDLKLPHEDAQIATGDDLDSADDARLAVMAARTNIFARTRPEQKHRLVHALRAGGEVVAMTGDGINDAPALREADIGVAMGERGTEVARASGDMVLLDDNFATIVRAVREGRRVFANLERAFSYLIAFHLPIVLAALVVPLTGEPLLLLPIHIVWLELVMHPTSSLVFEGDPPAPGLMRRPPRPPGSGLLSGPEVVRPLLLGLVLFGGILALYLGALAHGTAERESRAMAFAALVLGQVLLVLEERAGDAQLWRAAWHGNRVGPAVLGLTVVSLALALYLPWLADAVRLAPLSAIQIGIAAGVALLTTLWWEAVKLVRRP